MRALTSGVEAYQRGDFAQAARDFASVLKTTPDHADALHLLGMCAHRLGHPEDALQLVNTALEHDKRRAAFWANRAHPLKALGRLTDAKKSLKRALSLDPTLGPALLQLAQLTLHDGSLDVGLSLAQRALTATPSSSDARSTLQGALQLKARYYREKSAFKESEDRLLQAIALGPQAPLYVDLGNLQLALGRRSDSEHSFNQAIQLNPQSAEAHRNRAWLHHQRAQSATALTDIEAALQLDPSDDDSWRCFVEIVALVTDAPRPSLKPLLLRAYHRPGLDHQRLSRASLRLLAQQPALHSALNDDAPLNAMTVRLLNDEPLLHAVLSRSLIQDPQWERLITRVRARSDWSITLGCSIALCAFYGEYAWEETPEETQAIAAISPPSTEHEWVRFAAYRPLFGQPFAPPKDLPQLKQLIQTLYADPLLESKLADHIDVFALSDCPISAAVREQYERSPYPRLASLNTKAPKPLGTVLRSLFPHFTPMNSPSPLKVLIAGCGTGQQALAAASRYANSEVLAIDLSRASLACATRLAAAHSLTNIRFMQADILSVGALNERFDLIESGGVLHHMAQPIVGWEVLTGLLKPRGLMKIGLYSERARRTILLAHQWIAQKGYRATPHDIRRARIELLALAPTDPLFSLLYSPDFYSVSGLHDLIFHAHEHRFEIPQLQAAFKKLELEFIGFQHALPQVSQWYRERFPDDPAQRDLGRWEQVEAAHPDAFSGMYQFWVQRLT